MNDKPSKWLVAAIVMAPTAMEILDTSVANVSLAHIQGALNAGIDEVTWVLTSYLVANGIILPMSGWLSARFGRRRLLLTSVTGFTIASFLCGSAPTLSTLILCRVLQGLFGGSLQPLSQAILLESFPREERGTAMAFYAMGVVTAPILGPLLGGAITDHLSWRWVFFINLPVGIVSLVGIMAVIRDPPHIRELRRPFDPIGLGCLLVGVGSLQLMLDRGNGEDWFASHLIVGLALAAAIGLTALILWETVFSRAPLVDLGVFKTRSFAVGSLVIFLVFSAFFASLVLLPLFLQQLLGYTAFQAGTVLGPGGIATVLLLPLIGRLMRRGWARPILFVGVIIGAWAVHLMAGFSLQADYDTVLVPRLVQGVGLACFFVPLTTLTMTDVEPRDLGNATGLFALLRNLGGAIGVAVSSSILAHRTQVHHAQLSEALGRHQAPLAELSLRLAHIGVPNSIAGLAREVDRQAAMLAFNDGFRALSWVLLLVIPLVLFLPTPRKKAVTQP